MTIIKSFNPVELLSSSSVDADNYSAWVTSTYALNAKVTHGGRIWESMEENNNVQPSINTTKWLDIVPTNKLAVFDNYPSTISKNNGSSIWWEFETLDFLKVISLAEITGSELIITFTDIQTGDVTYTNTILLQEYDEPQNSYEVITLWNTIKPKKSHIETIPIVAYGQRLRVEITPLNGVASLGYLDFGDMDFLGCTLYGTSVDLSLEEDIVTIDGYSKPIDIVARISQKNSYKVSVTNNDTEYEIMKKLKTILGKRVTVLGTDDGDLRYFIIGLVTSVPITLDYTMSFTFDVAKIDEN